MNTRGHLTIGGVVLPYYPAYYWGGMGSGTTNADTTTSEGDKGAGDSSASAGASTDGGGSM